MAVTLIWAESRDGWIGIDGDLPWRLPEDQARFKELTVGGTVLMGRATWDSLPAGVRPLPHRRNLVLTRQEGLKLPGATTVHGVPEALAAAPEEDLWVIGGAEVYRALMPYADHLEVTQVDRDVHGDTPAPDPGSGWVVTARWPGEGWATSRTGLDYRFLTFGRREGRVDRGGHGPGADATL